MSDKCYMYHPVIAPTGAVFDSDKVCHLDDSWVDTPAKFTEAEQKEENKPKPKAKVQPRKKAE